MNIDSYVNKNGGLYGEHYKIALYDAYERFKDMSINELNEWQVFSREEYRKSPTYQNTANCMIIYELLKEQGIKS